MVRDLSMRRKKMEVDMTSLSTKLCENCARFHTLFSGCLYLDDTITFHSQLEEIKRFRGTFFFLSNYRQHEISYHGIFGVFVYKSAEHAYQAEKFENYQIYNSVMSTISPHSAKQLSRVYKQYIRSDWNEIKVDIMEDIVSAKFSDPFMASLLLATRDIPLLEGNTWGDKFWGVDINTGEGMNHLGNILMKVRHQLREG